MLILIRALTYATLFIALVLVFVPGTVLEWSGVTRPGRWGPVQAVGLVAAALGLALALWCVLTFALVGRGTPAPFDPPRRLVVRGPYRFVRNPMYIGAGIALAGAAFFLPIVVDLDLCQPVSSRDSPVRCLVRRAHFTANFRV